MEKIKYSLAILFVISSMVALSACTNTSKNEIDSTSQSVENIDADEIVTQSESTQPYSETKAINISVNEINFIAELYDSVAAESFTENLPLTLKMSELNGNEKYNYLDFSMPTNSFVPSQINAGDIMLYGDNCLVLFYKSFTTTYSYTPIAHITNPEQLEAVAGDNDITVKFENIN